MAGALEDLFRDLNVNLATDLRAVEVRPHNVRPTALTMLVPSVWESISSDRVIRHVKRRDLVDAANNFYAGTSPLDFGRISQLGVHDGRTVNVHHFEALWEGLCLSGPTDSVWLSNQHRQAMVSLADKRNAVAHFETDPRLEAFRFSYGDLRLLATRILETVERLQEHTIIWLDRHKM